MSSCCIMICDYYKAYYKEELLINEITTLLTCMHPLLDANTYRHFLIISQALLMMTGRITMLSISRWTDKGGSYRTVQRFFSKDIPWCSLNWAIAKTFLKKSRIILIAGDATTVTKSGKKTFGQVFLFHLLTCSSWDCLPNAFIAGCRKTNFMANVDRTDTSKAKAEKAGSKKKQKTNARPGKAQRFKKQK